MWMEKIRRGVLAVQSDGRFRYVQPSLMQRAVLLWTFRNFHVLPEEVLSRFERNIVTAALANGRFVAPTNGNGYGDYHIGTIEKRTPFPPRKPAEAVEVSGTAFYRAR